MNQKQSKRLLYGSLVIALVAIAIEHTPAGHLVSSASAQSEKSVLPEVDAAPVLLHSMTDWQSYTGRLQAVSQVDVRPRIAGAITSVKFKDGALVKQGDLLFTIDDQTYVAAVDLASAELQAAKARAGYAESEAKRAENLWADKAMSQREYEDKTNQRLVANARLGQAKAALETAKVNLSYTRITAPISGRISRAELTLGNMVSGGYDAPILSRIVAIDSIYASFEVDEQSYLRYLNDARNRKVPVELRLAGNGGDVFHGYIASIDNAVDASSDTIRIRALFDNPNGRLVPGLTAQLKVEGGLPHPTMLVSASSIGTDQDRRYVWVVNTQGVVEYRQIEVGAIYGDLQAVNKGLQQGDMVLLTGLQRIHAGERVKVRSRSMPAASVLGS